MKRIMAGLFVEKISAHLGIITFGRLRVKFSPKVVSPNRPTIHPQATSIHIAKTGQNVKVKA